LGQQSVEIGVTIAAGDLVLEAECNRGKPLPVLVWNAEGSRFHGAKSR